MSLVQPTSTIEPTSTEDTIASTQAALVLSSATLSETAINASVQGVPELFTTSSSQNHSSISIPNTAPAGGISMTRPPQTAISFYKIAPSEIVTFGWNFTYILQDSDKLTVSAICDNGNTYPVGPTDGVIPGTATEVSWDLHSWQVNNPGQPLAQGTYTLTMWDERGKTALPVPGRMRPYNSLRFGLFTPQPYMPLASGWSCPGCRNAGVLSAASHPAFIGFFISALVILVSGLHLLRPNAF